MVVNTHKKGDLNGLSLETEVIFFQVHHKGFITFGCLLQQLFDAMSDHDTALSAAFGSGSNERAWTILGSFCEMKRGVIIKIHTFGFI